MTEAGTKDSISGVFEKDHREIDSILAGVDYAQPRKAVPAFGEFDRRLERHIGWEEELLFPAVAKVNPGLEQGPLYVMREEHRLIREAKAKALAALNGGDGPAAEGHAKRMTDILIEHNMKEERILYPACDDMLAARAQEEILRAVRSAK